MTSATSVLPVCHGMVCLVSDLASKMASDRVTFCVYIDGLLHRLYESGVGCYIGHIYTGALADADDVVLLAPTLSALRTMLKICEDFSKEFSVIFNASKSVCLLVSKATHKAFKMSVDDLQFALDDSCLARQ